MHTKETLIQQLIDMGIRPNDTVMVHTSLRAIGPIENGADGLIDAFIAHLTDGLFLVPTHTWNNVHKDQPIFDVNQTVPCIGTLPTVAAFRKDGIRSLHPTHSVWAHGKHAAEFIRDEELATSPTPVGGLWDRLADVGAKILLLGVGNDKNTFIHSIDERADVPDRLQSEPYDTVLIDQNGKEYHGKMRGHRCSRCGDVSANFPNFEPALIETGAQSFGKLGDAVVRMVDANKCREVILKILSNAKEDLCIGKMEIPTEYWR